MMYFYCVVYILVILWIQDCVPQSKNKININTNSTNILPNEPYTVTCYSTVYAALTLRKNHVNITHFTWSKCQFEKDVNEEDYECILSYVPNINYTLKLTVLHGEKSPTTVQWDCLYYRNKNINSSLNITVRNPDLTRTNWQTTSSTQTTQSFHLSYITPFTGTPKTAASSLPPPVSGNNNVDKNTIKINTILICIVGVLILINILIGVMFQNKRKIKDGNKQESSRSLAPEPRRSPGEANYDDLDRSMIDGHTYDTAQASGVQP